MGKTNISWNQFSWLYIFTKFSLEVVVFYVLIWRKNPAPSHFHTYSFKTPTRPLFSTQLLNNFDEFFSQIIVSSIDCHTTTFSAAFRPWQSNNSGKSMVSPTCFGVGVAKMMTCPIDWDRKNCTFQDIPPILPDIEC